MSAPATAISLCCAVCVPVQVDKIVGAKMGKDVNGTYCRMYLVQWMDENPDDPDEPWQTWETHASIVTTDPDGNGDAMSDELAKQIERLDCLTAEEEAALTMGTEKWQEMKRYASEGKLQKDDRILHFVASFGYRPGTVTSVESDGKIKVKYDAIHPVGQQKRTAKLVTLNVNDDG